ncbi:cytochrome b [Tabrizicola sp.]|uniref:cytochrome b n=1 Tax=Tabrizicola sp. TaxID=2005166 RepID=UPI003F31C74C
MSNQQTYDLTSRINHWIMAVAMIGMVAFGLYLGFGGLPRETRGPLIDLHKAIGVLVLIFGVWRVGLRLFRGFPPPASEMPSWQETASKAVHWALLASIIIMPVSGIVASVFRGRAIDVFGLFEIPAQAENPGIAGLAGQIHEFVGIGLAVVIAIHVAAALKHHVVDKDATLTRMLTGRAASTDETP